MRNSELRIGNYITGEYYDDDGEVYELCKVLTVDSCSSAEYPIMVDSKSDIEYFNVFQSIPLTEEWLLKFGFDKWKGVFRIKLRDSLFLRCNFSKDILGLVVDEYDNPIDSAARETISLNPIKSVHQLQNLYFALTGEELKINP